MDDGAPSQAGLRIGNKRLSNLPFTALLRGFLLYGGICLVILYLGAFGVGHSPGFAYLVATEIGDAFGDSLTSERASVDASLGHLQVFELRTSTNNNQKTQFTTIQRVALHRKSTRVVKVEVDGFACDVRVQKSGLCQPTRLGFLTELPLFNQIPFLAKPVPAPPVPANATSAKPAEEKSKVLPEEDEEDRSRKFNLAALPALHVRDGAIRMLNPDGNVLADIRKLNLVWTPAAASPEGRDRLELSARYSLAHRKVPEQELKIEVSLRDGKVAIDTLEAEQALLMELGPFLSARFNPPTRKSKVEPLPAKESPVP